MITDYRILGSVMFSDSLFEIRQNLEKLRKDNFEALEKITIVQDIVDEYPYEDGVGQKLIEIQKIINQVDISNCFILLITANGDIAAEIDFVTRFYSVDPQPMEFHVVEGQYKKTVRQYPDTACQKLWNHFYVGTDGNVNACCLADHRFPLGNIDNLGTNDIIADNRSRMRDLMAQGYRPRACASCYEKENSGLASARQTCDPSTQTANIIDIDIRLNNICNFKCRMCSEYFSSAIQQETIELYGKNAILGFEKISLDRSTTTVQKQRLEKILPLITADLDSIYFAGGEPLITSEHYVILDRLLAVGNTDLAIRYNTNLSTLSYKQSNVIDKWNRFEDVTVDASIDASGTVAEYMRHGTIWKDILTNIHVIKNYAAHVRLKISSAVSCLTIENLIDLQQDWIETGLFVCDDFTVSVVTSPNFLSPAVLPQHHKKRLTAAIQNHIECFAGTRLAKQWKDVLQWMNGKDYTFALQDFRHRTKILDTHRDESFAAVFPEYKDLL